MCANDAPWRAFKMKPGEIAGKSADERLEKGKTHHQQSRRDGVEPRFDSGPDHVGKRDCQRAAEHQIRNDAQCRQKNPEPKKKKRKREPFDTAQISGHVGLRSGIHRLEKTLAKNSVIDDRPLDEPAKSRSAINLSAPFRGPGRSEENQMLEAQKRLGFAVTFLLFQKRAERESAMMPHDRRRTERNHAAGLL